MSYIHFDLSWLSPPDAQSGADRPLLSLLAGVRAHGSIAGAAKAARLSYRHAWGMLGRWEQLLGRSVVVPEQGRGAKLAPLGEQLLEADLRIRRRLEPILARLSAELERQFAASLQVAEPTLRIVASHDLALLQLRDLALANGIALDLHVRGSSESLAAYARGECELAGFHLIAGRPDLDLRLWLAPHRDAILRFATRRQGLMVKRGNPKRIGAIADLARPAVRFVNRQEGSGTRVLFDRLLAEVGVRSRQIRGYAVEEYTHLAVAATVASGMADAAFGIEAAAVHHGLAFVPIATEEYLVACPLARLKSKQIVMLRKLMASADFRAATAGLAGYDLQRAGRLLRSSALIGTPPR